MEFLDCEWMGIKLKSPYVLASLSLMSNTNIDEHIKYFKKVESAGAGAIILPSLNPKNKGGLDSFFNETVADCLPLKTGLINNENMAFTVLGPTKPNIISINYAINLAKRSKEFVKVPVIGSLVNIGSKQDFLKAIKILSDIGLDGIELNFSCPNIINNDNSICITKEFFCKIREVTNLPLSLKITPSINFEVISEVLKEVDSLTISNAYIGLVPPNINYIKNGYNNSKNMWAPSGIYGPYERYLTYHRLYLASKFKTKKVDLACVGGIVAPEQGIEAILLGANVVQLSSAIAWNGIKIFHKFNNQLKDYDSFTNVAEMCGYALKNIVKNTDKLYENSKIKKRLKAHIDETKCTGCCNCCNRLCLAIEIKKTHNGTMKAYVNDKLCSGCGWCSNFCTSKAIFYI